MGTRRAWMLAVVVGAMTGCVNAEDEVYADVLWTLVESGEECITPPEEEVEDIIHVYNREANWYADSDVWYDFDGRLIYQDFNGSAEGRTCGGEWTMTLELELTDNGSALLERDHRDFDEDCEYACGFTYQGRVQELWTDEEM